MDHKGGGSRANKLSRVLAADGDSLDITFHCEPRAAHEIFRSALSSKEIASPRVKRRESWNIHIYCSLLCMYRARRNHCARMIGLAQLTKPSNRTPVNVAPKLNSFQDNNEFNLKERYGDSIKNTELSRKLIRISYETNNTKQKLQDIKYYMSEREMFDCDVTLTRPAKVTSQFLNRTPYFLFYIFETDIQPFPNYEQKFVV